MTDPTCKVCRGDWPARECRIADCGLTHAYLYDDQFFAGWSVLVLKKHVTELFHLSGDERTRLVEEVSAVAEILAAVYGAQKVNYELLGNQLPHIHWHVIPRLPGDPAPLEPVWLVKHSPTKLGAIELQEQVSRIQTHLRSYSDGLFFRGA